MATLYAHEFQPRSELIVPSHEISHARFAAIDAHNHLPVAESQKGKFDRDLKELVREMDFLNLKMIVNLSGGSGETLLENL